MTTLRAQRMIDSAPSYYQDSLIYESLQQTVATEYDNQEAINEDIQRQLYVPTATWGLNYWEEGFGITVNEQDAYEIRRGRVIAKLIGSGNFGARHLRALAAGYGEEIRVEVDTSNFLFTATFLKGIPVYIEEYKALVENIIHAHLGIQYKFEWHISEAASLTVGYVSYVYPLPIVNTINCGTWPTVVTQGLSITDNISINVSGRNVDKIYDLCGTYPDIMTQGISVNDNSSVNVVDSKVDKVYKFCNTINSSEGVYV